METVFCREVVRVASAYPVEPGGPFYCGGEAEVARLQRTSDGVALSALGRPEVVGRPFCRAHGGAVRSLAAARRDWLYLAPAIVGNARAVLRAGCRVFSSAATTVQLCWHPESRQPPQWVVRLPRLLRDAALGLELERGASNPRRAVRKVLKPLGLWSGALVTVDQDVAMSAARTLLREYGFGPVVDFMAGCVTPRDRPWVAYLGSLHVVGAFASRMDACAAGLTACHARRDLEREAIRVARGGTLDWGTPLSPVEPMVLQSDTHGDENADALRPSGQTPATCH
jgi:hypothetical protein